MFRRNKKHAITSQMEAEISRASIQQERATSELEEAKSLAQHLKVIRDDNHFTRDFRIALGIQNGHK